VGLGVLFGFIQDTFRQLPSIIDLLVGDIFFEQKARNRTDPGTDEGSDDDLAGHENSLALYIEMAAQRPWCIVCVLNRTDETTAQAY
jgi:hypothetical protein